jgi:steroid delta-isomerase-like uncharacterized protein
MSTEQNKALARRWFTDIIVNGDMSAADDVFAANHVIHDPHAPPGGWPNGPEGLKMVAAPFRVAFPDVSVSVEDQIAEGDRVVTRWSARATHTGPLNGIPASGRKATVTGANIARIANGKIVESWFNFDMLTLLQGIGVIPAPGHEAAAGAVSE